MFFRVLDLENFFSMFLGVWEENFVEVFMWILVLGRLEVYCSGGGGGGGVGM